MNLNQMEFEFGNSTPAVGSRTVLTDRRFLTCPECGWVHYTMAMAEKAASDLVIERYHFNEVERRVYESTLRQCLQCEGPASEFRAASEEDLVRAAGHMVTPVWVEAEVGAQ